jgi:hypothetical protein
MKNKVPHGLYLGFHSGVFPENSYLQFATHVILTVQVRLRSVKNEGPFT